MARSKMDVEGFELVIKRFGELDSNAKAITEKMLKKSHQIITKKAEEAIQPQNLPAKGDYSKGDTLKSLKRDVDVSWAGTEASCPVGFDIPNGGLASIFMMYGTPRHMKVQKLRDAFWGKKTREEIRNVQEETFYTELRRLDR